MSSARLREANRINARHSTGPKSAAGKARAAQNARRHGLNVSASSDPKYCELVELLATSLARDDESAEVQELGRRIAEAQIDIVRVRQARQGVLARDLIQGTPDPTIPAATDVSGSTASTRSMPELTQYLNALDRYERRALSRRKFAIRNFDLLRSAGRHSDP